MNPEDLNIHYGLLGSQESTAIQMGGVLPYKLEVYCRTFWTSCRGWGFRNIAHMWAPDSLWIRLFPTEERPNSKKGVGRTPSRCLLDSPFLEPLLRTLLRTLSPSKTLCKTPSKNPSWNLLESNLETESMPSKSISDCMRPGCGYHRPSPDLKQDRKHLGMNSCIQSARQLLGGRFGYFLFFSARGGGGKEGGVRGARREGGGRFFYWKSPEGGSPGREGPLGPGGCLRRIGEFCLGEGGGVIFFLGLNWPVFTRPFFLFAPFAGHPFPSPFLGAFSPCSPPRKVLCSVEKRAQHRAWRGAVSG